MAVISRLPQGGGISENELEYGIGVWESQGETPGCIMRGLACIYNDEIHWFSGASHYIGASSTNVHSTLPTAVNFCCTNGKNIYVMCGMHLYKSSGDGVWTEILVNEILLAPLVICSDDTDIYFTCNSGTNAFNGTYKISMEDETLTKLSSTHPPSISSKPLMFYLNKALRSLGGDSSSAYTCNYVLNESDGVWTRVAQTLKINYLSTFCVYDGFVYIVFQDLNTSLGHVCYRYDGENWVMMPAPPLKVDTSYSNRWGTSIYKQALLVDSDNNLWFVGGTSSNYLMNYKAKLIEYRKAGKEK